MGVEPVGLVLTGGGARGAYQVGAVKALAEILGARQTPFQVLAGSSAGAINATALAGRAEDFSSAAEELEARWLSLEPGRIYRTDAARLLAIGSHWLRDLSGGGILGRSRINFLLDASPLRDFLAEVLPLARIPAQIASGRLRGVAVSVTSYDSGLGITFFDGAPDVRPWVRATRVGLRERLRLPHVLASAAIPIFFPPVRIKRSFYGDGCVRMTAPLSPAVHMGAERIVAISVRHWRASEELLARRRPRSKKELALSEIGGVLMNAVLLDALEADVERLETVNRLVGAMPLAERRKSAAREIPILVLRPSQDLGDLAEDQYLRFPRAMRYLLKGLGATTDHGSDLLSYLAFEPVYVGRLVELGYRDTLVRRAEVERFFGVESRARKGA